MNDRTREFMGQAIKYSWDNWSDNTSRDQVAFEKFAEMIVRECCNVILHYSDVDEGVAVTKKHFGVNDVN